MADRCYIYIYIYEMLLCVCVLAFPTAALPTRFIDTNIRARVLGGERKKNFQPEKQI